MRKIIALTLLCLISIFPNLVSANGTDDCIKLSTGKMLTHDLNTPYLDNCYIIDNAYKSGFMVSLGLIDGVKGTLNIHRYSPSTGEITLLENQYSDNGTASFHNSQSIDNDQYVVRLNDLTFPNQAKNVSVSKVVVDGNIYLTIVVRNVASEAIEPPPNGGGGFCDPDTGICFEPQGGDQEYFSNSAAASSEGNECTGDLAPPTGFNENYDIELEAENMRIFSQEIDSQPFLPDSVKNMQKALYFGIVMAPRSFYDLKTNENWLSTADAGNYNYGYLGAAIGFDKETLIEMSGLLQMAGDELDAGRDYPLMTNLAKAIRDDDFSQFDNYPEDPDEINSGYDAEKSGCTPNTNSSNNQTGSGTGGGGSSGWSPVSRIFLGASGCIGNCSVPIGTVKITDLKDVE